MKTFKTLVSIFFIFFLNGYLLAITQADKIKNLEEQLKNDKGIKELNILVNLTEACKKIAPDKSIQYGIKAMALANKNHDDISMGYALIHMAYAYARLQKTEKSRQTAQEAIDLFQAIGNKPGLAEANFQYGILHLAEARYHKALEYFFKALNLYQETGDKDKITYGNYNIGIVYLNLKQYPKAMDFFQTTLRLARGNDNLNYQALALNNIGLTYDNQENYQEALQYYWQAFNLFKKLIDEDWMSYMYSNISWAYLKLNQSDLAMKYSQIALGKYKQMRDDVFIFRALYLIGLIHYHDKNYQNAVSYFEQAIPMARLQKRNKDLEGLYLDYTNLLSDMGNFKAALEYHRLYSEIHEKILNKENLNNIAELQEQHEADKKQKENEEQRRILEVERLRRNVLILALGILLIVLALVVRKFKYFFQFWKKQTYVGQFRLEKIIGKGGMGVVYRARSIRDKNLTGAVKVLKDELFDNEESRRRFKNEGTLFDKLGHPHIVKVFERGEYKDRLYLAMEFLEGKTLDILIKEGSFLEPIKSLHLIRQIVDTLSFIHEKGIIHRDLKPSNIMLIEKDGDPCFLKLLDFGLAKVMKQTRLTRTGELLGTVAYMSPEQLMGLELTPATDIYSLGIIAYEMVTSHIPFSDENEIKLIKKILDQSPVEPGHYRREIPPAFNGLIMSMIDKNPAQRPSLGDIAQVIEAITRY